MNHAIMFLRLQQMPLKISKPPHNTVEIIKVNMLKFLIIIYTLLKMITKIHYV